MDGDRQRQTVPSKTQQTFCGIQNQLKPNLMLVGISLFDNSVIELFCLMARDIHSESETDYCSRVAHNWLSKQSAQLPQQLIAINYSPNRWSIGDWPALNQASSTHMGWIDNNAESDGHH